MTWTQGAVEGIIVPLVFGGLFWLAGRRLLRTAESKTKSARYGANGR